MFKRKVMERLKELKESEEDKFKSGLRCCQEFQWSDLSRRDPAKEINFAIEDWRVWFGRFR